MGDSNALRIRASVALLSTLFSGIMMNQTGVLAATEDQTAGAPRLEARVAGTGGDGLTVRSGPGTSYAATGLLADGTQVHVLSGPRFDETGRDWYLVTGYGASGDSGWTAGAFLDRQADRDGGANVVAQAVGPTQRSLLATVTAYTWQVPGNGADGTITRSGTVAHWGTVAVDPSVIPLGSRLQIEGYDLDFVAEDTGGAVVGNRVEIFFPDEDSALRFGVRSLHVTVVDPGSAPPQPSHHP